MMNTMRDLLVHEVRDLLSAEKQLVKALPAMEKAATAPKLAKAFRTHLKQTEEQVTRLVECLNILGEQQQAIRCKAMEGLVEEGSEMAEEEGNPFVRDAGLIGSAQRVEHYEIAAYGTCVELAALLHEESVADLLRKTLEEERMTDELLTQIANEDVNPKAMLSSEKMAVG